VTLTELLRIAPDGIILHLVGDMHRRLAIEDICAAEAHVFRAEIPDVGAVVAGKCEVEALSPRRVPDW
jgi:hypothetical protein